MNFLCMPSWADVKHQGLRRPVNRQMLHSEFDVVGYDYEA